MDTAEKANHVLTVTYGSDFYKLAAAGLALGAVVTVGVIGIGRMVFKDTFDNVKVLPR